MRERILCDSNEVTRVCRPTHTRGEYEVVTRPLALDAQAMGRKPGERMKPVHRTRDLCDQLREAIPPSDVGKLVQENHLAPLGIPARYG